MFEWQRIKREQKSVENVDIEIDRNTSMTKSSNTSD